MRRGSIKNRLIDVWLGTPLLHLAALFHRRRSRPPTQVRRIGVMSAPALGDTLLFSAPLQDLRALYPNAELVHICMKPSLAAAEIIPGADRRLLISLTQPMSSIRALRAERFDLLLDFTPWQRISALYTLLSGARFTVGFRTPGMHRSPGYDRLADHRRDRHELENHRALFREATGVEPTYAPAVDAGPITASPFADEPNLVVFHLWAAGQRSWLREWPEERWVELATRLKAQLGDEMGGDALFVLTGAPADRLRCEPMLDRLRAAGLRAEPFVSPDGFRSLTHLLLRARVVVSVNTGVMHLAAIAGAPTVSLNGPTAELRWGARGPNVANVQPGDGSGGYLHLGFEFQGQPEDIMERISVDQVFTACEAVMAGARSLSPTLAEAR
jgi:ADP-heptose:LPS heptosyltransferase